MAVSDDVAPGLGAVGGNVAGSDQDWKLPPDSSQMPSICYYF
jgi:hypothetical protein